MPVAALAVQLASLGLAARIDMHIAAIAAATVSAAAGLVAWAWAFRRHRALGDTPTSRIASAAQGYAELRGRGVALGGLPVVSRATGLPCLWYRFRIEERDSGGHWQVVESGESDASFLIDDGTGQCLVDVEDAEVLTGPPDVQTTEREQRCTAWHFLIGCRLCVLGDFRTLGSADPELDIGKDMSALLADWKRDRPELLRRFDLDRDGTVDMREWEGARRAARREVEQQHREIRSAADLHTMRRPVGGLPFLVSNLDLDKMAWRYRLWSGLHVGVFFVALLGLGWSMRHA